MAAKLRKSDVIFWVCAAMGVAAAFGTIIAILFFPSPT